MWVMSMLCSRLPSRFKDTMVNTVGHRTTEMALELGLLYTSPEALKIGLVDQLVPEEQVLTTATETMTKWLAIPGQIHCDTSLLTLYTVLPKHHCSHIITNAMDLKRCQAPINLTSVVMSPQTMFKTLSVNVKLI